MNVLPLGAGLLFSVGSAALLVRSVRALARARSSQSWPRADGRIRESEAVRFQSTSRHRTLFVTYEYAVGGATFEGTRVAFYTLTGDEARTLARRHADSPEVPVFYDPENPAESTLIPGPRAEKPYSDVLIAGIGLVVGLALMGAAAAGHIG